MNPHVNPQRSPSGGPQSPSQQYMTFRLGEQLYGVNILEVQEIRRYAAPTPLPDVPLHVKGVINLRGAVVPVFDMRVRFNLPSAAIDRLTVIIVVVIKHRSVGLVVDEVTRVARLSAESLRPAPTLSRHVDTSFIIGLAAQEEELVTILDVARLVADDIGELP